MSYRSRAYALRAPQQRIAAITFGMLILCTLLIQTAQAQANDRLVRVGDFFHQYAQLGAVAYTYHTHGIKGAAGCAAGAAVNNEATLYLKHRFNHRRPNGGDLGMPSGHTSRVASAFGCLLGQDGWSVPTMAFATATAITAYSRVEGDYHTPKQVLAGAVLGTAMGYLGTQHLSISAHDIQVSIPLGGANATGPKVTQAVRKSLIAFANHR